MVCTVIAFVALDHYGSSAQSAAPSPEPTTSSASLSTSTEVPGILVPGGTIIEVALAEPLSSATAKEGDQIAIRVVKEVDVDGWLVVPANSPGHATVSTAENAGSNGHGGQLGVTIDWVYSQDGGKVALSATSHASDNGQQKGAANTATILSYVLLGPLGLFAHNFVHGRDVTVDTKHVFSVFVDRDVHVVSALKATSPTAGYDK
jgi:hypothetical protein